MLVEELGEAREVEKVVATAAVSVEVKVVDWAEEAPEAETEAAMAVAEEALEACSHLCGR